MISIGSNTPSKIYIGDSEVSRIYAGDTEVWSGIDVDALNFINLTGASDTVLINNWVSGVKKLGLWENMICWPMRLNQNYSSGDSLLSLGGYSSVNGVLVNDPQKTLDGILKTAGLDQSITTSLPVGFPLLIMTVISHDLTSGTTGVSNHIGASNNLVPRLTINASLNISLRGIWTSAAQTYSNFRTRPTNIFFGYATSGTQRGTLNKTLAWETSSDEANPSGSLNRIAGLSNMTGVSGSVTTAFTAFFIGVDTNTDDIYDLYKSTIGQGLILP